MSRPVGVAALMLLAAIPNVAQAQGDDELARRAWQSARSFALAGRADSALASYARAATLSEGTGDRAMVAAALRGAAQVHAVYIGCGDSASILFRQSLEKSGEGDRQSVDAYVRLLSTRGNVAEAQQLLNKSYASVEGLGRAITRETMTWYQDMAAIQRASGHEAAALASLTSALGIADRLRSGDVTDSAGKKAGAEVNPVNYWLIYDLAQLRLNAKSPSVLNVATGKKLMDALVTAGIGLDEQDELIVPVARLFDTLVLRAHQCTMNGGRCVAPVLAHCAHG